nr:hypothetical protein [uncultured Shimia sp.]
MKSFNWTRICAAIFVASGLGTPSLADDAYRLDCKGGGNMVLGAEWVAAIGDLKIEIRYDRAARGSSQAPLTPGTCAWADRALREGEPLALSLVIEDAHKVNLACSQMLCEFRYADPKVVKLMSLAQSNATWGMLVRNREGTMQVIEVMY